MNNIISVITILISLGLFFGFVDPTYKEIKILQSDKAEYDKAVNNSLQLQVERDKLLTKRNSLKTEDLNKLSKLLPDNIDNVRLIMDIDNIANRFGMRIRNLATETVSDDTLVGIDQEKYGIVSLKFSTTGTYETFLAFLSDLERSLRIVDIIKVEFTTPSEDKVNLYDYDVTIRTYWLR